MNTATEPLEIKSLPRLNRRGPDDLFICCASFEERCLSSPALMGSDFLTKYAIIFTVEESLYKKQVEKNMFRLQTGLRSKATEGIFVISSQRESPVEGVRQMEDILRQCKLNADGGPYITLDISGFTKIYLLELLHYLVTEKGLAMPRLLHTTQRYLPTRLTRGIEQITTIPHYYGSPALDKPTVLVVFLGFEPERALAVWQQYNPARTIALITNPPRPGNPDYLKYARQNNAELLARPSVEVRDVKPDNPYDVKQVLDAIYEEVKDTHNMVIGPFGTKPQVVGLFLFGVEHRKVQVIYSFPATYTRSYLQRQPGATLLLPVAPAMA
ncbi:MAG TPA: hypothetical protein VJ377_06085 [Dehalococcoidales bacterium]|nr:MAG: hypothetical protein A2Z05_01180 [Chloroflexi bacterium RBG_16_60_22]HJX13082.1 hypothetical protein [Dehalococcoidales bacterium]